ncbi:MAG: nucleotidyltransferase domain-containing protein [Deltaproteobacteria bacterium]|nr:nucleotidyltransferase domain-containing protein [Deltaproteobacteria bacterium]
MLAIYLFGSQARGDFRESSDIDLGFLFTKTPSLDNHAKILTDLQSLLASDKIDIAILNDASPQLQFDSVSEGQLLYRNMSEEELNQFELCVIKKYFDTEAFRRVQDLYLKEKILGIPSGF